MKVLNDRMCNLEHGFTQNRKGSNCSISGKSYELKVHSVLNNSVIALDKTVGGSTHCIDISGYYNGTRIGIEVKKGRAPDWVQCRIDYNEDCKRWMCVSRCSHPDDVYTIFDTIIERTCVFNNIRPPIGLSHQTWKTLKASTNTWNDMYIDIDPAVVGTLYAIKGCQYIQISGYGLYHLGENPLNVGVPPFIVKSRMRFRVKVHASNISGRCKLSVTASCIPYIRLLPKSKYSLDSVVSMPPEIRQK